MHGAFEASCPAGWFMVSRACVYVERGWEAGGVQCASGGRFSAQSSVCGTNNSPATAFSSSSLSMPFSEGPSHHLFASNYRKGLSHLVSVGL